jgi:lipopolysaccharide export LptBFGC system permease protein LptF
LLIDFGSTYTKVTAVDLDSEALLGTAASYTTIQTDIDDGLTNAVRKLEEKTGKLDFAARYACSSAAGGLRMVTSGLVPELTAEAKNDCRYDAWGQLMAPFACIVITLFAIPAGIATGRQSVFRGILGALGMYFAFYGVTIALMVVAKNGWLAPVPAAVLPVLLFLALGIRSFYRQR